MYKKNKAILFLCFNLLTSIVCADAAPVYDVDQYPPQFAGEKDAGAGSAAPLLSTDERLRKIEQQLTNFTEKIGRAHV